MNYHVAQINIARFKILSGDAAMKEFIDQLDPVNTVAETAPGFVWRLKDETNSQKFLTAFDESTVYAILFPSFETHGSIALFIRCVIFLVEISNKNNPVLGISLPVLSLLKAEKQTAFPSGIQSKPFTMVIKVSPADCGLAAMVIT